ncbi:hypothetical protein HKO22_07175 [Peptoniphilus sp. AGMB00490]|uniref:2TM domain-containing protein n=1 Tax=Peptoniphilus faecalis TaxID=2731255 RepID=A0A848RJ87_9FIRM|nr:hypothetical protein [Peptoniphilus faecalis]NMW85513.1 hypothetical protein [Peptoniphilus faecalis]
MDKRKRNRNRIKSQYSKFIVTLVILLNILFTVIVLFIFAKTGTEPSTLIGAWFSFTTVELWSLSRIKKKKIEKEIHEIKSQNDEYQGG